MSEEVREQNDLEIPFLAKNEEPAPPAPVSKPKKKLRIPAPAWFAAGCAVVLGAVLIGWHVRENILGEEVSLLDSSVPEFAGYSTGGYLAADFAPEAAALEHLRETVAQRQEKGRNTADLERLISSVSCGFDKASGYSNNENLTYACSYDQQAAEEAGIRLSNTVRTYTVSGLAEYAVLDVFSGVSADWQLSQDGLSIGIYAPQELRDMGISYSWSYGGDSYNGETVSIHAEFDQNVLMSYGYIVNNDEIVWTLGAMPEQITDAEALSEDERTVLRETVRAMLENELAGCSNRAALTAFTGTYSIEITGIEQAYIERTGMGFFDDSNSFRISFDLDTNSEFMLNDYGSFRASYTGQIYRMADGSLRFLTNTVHACRFTGMFGTYSLSETSE